MLVTSCGSLDSRSNSRNYRHDAVMGTYTNNYRYAFAARVSATSGSDGPSGGAQQHNPPQRWARGPPRDHSNTDEHRYWIHNSTPPPLSAGRFVVVSFNILGVDNANQHCRELYWHIPPFVMDWNYRKKRILLELGLWSPDIICLQEVDRFDDLQTDLVRQGYEGIFKGRTGGSSDGCAIFWRTKKFVLLQEESIEYQELNLRHNVAQLCVLRITCDEPKRGKGKRPKGMEDNLVVVCNIHVLFNPNRGDIKLGQVRHLLEKAYSLSQAWGGIPVVVAGDFNTVPQSPLYQYLCNGMLNLTNYDRRAISGQVDRSRGVRQVRVERWTSTTSQCQVENEGRTVLTETSVVSSDDRLLEDPCAPSFKWTSEELETATGIASESFLKHNLELQSAYSSIEGSQETRDSSNEPLVTTYHGNFMGTVDYIWFTDGLMPVRVLELLPVRVLQRIKGLPSKKWGSDHLALACEFAFKQ
ncbi:hypothetical protein GOP47_0008518 [Adiantum capillus-veneris]|uniref:Endonuclease/exonuclease/phosphatase domain-containing protein n=1 Tax=Adiantum capillus-veneris TaxID=13818 RepID=A0A9D4UYR9_ADICA|nr:hypothetical protein GOP47_0008518 [Adiantum capillus-veneris]